MLPTRIAALAAILLALSIIPTKADICNEMAGRCSITGNYATETVSRHQKLPKAIKTARKGLEQALIASYEGVTMLPHPAGCPSTRFCACGAAVEIFGSAIRSLWPSRAWFKYPRSAPAYGMVAVRPGHVFVLRSHIQGDTWMVADYNSGGHQSRLHPRSIRGYTIVNPHGSVAMN